MTFYLRESVWRRQPCSAFGTERKQTNADNRWTMVGKTQIQQMSSHVKNTSESFCEFRCKTMEAYIWIFCETLCLSLFFRQVQEYLYSPVSVQNLITKVIRTEIVCIHVCPMWEVWKLVEKITLIVVPPVCSIL